MYMSVNASQALIMKTLKNLIVFMGRFHVEKGFTIIVVVSSRLVPGSVVGVTVALDTTQKTLKEWEMIDWLATFLQRQMHCC